jgi:cytochrome c551/c552
MKTSASWAALFVWSASALLIATTAHAVDIQLPPETAKLRTSTLPGYAVAAQKCGICHSADYVDYQPPNMTKAQWTSEMTKMQKAYGAPISDDEVKVLGIYLAATYGDAKTVTEADAAPASIAPAAAALDVAKLIEDNGCLACHAIDKMIFGPAYHDVATKYKADPQAVARLVTSIQQGGVGKWGANAMPPFATLKPEEAKVLAEYVMKQ